MFDALFSDGNVLFFSDSAESARDFFSVRYLSVDSTLIETYLDNRLTLQTDPFQIAGIAILTMDP